MIYRSKYSVYLSCPSQYVIVKSVCSCGLVVMWSSTVFEIGFDNRMPLRILHGNIMLIIMSSYLCYSVIICIDATSDNSIIRTVSYS